MSNHIYKWKYTSETEYKIIQIRKLRNRPVSEDHGDYLLFLEEGNTPEVIPYVAPVPPSLEELKTSKIAMLKMQAKIEIEKVYPDFKQRSAALGIYEQEYVDLMIETIKTTKFEVDKLEEQINKAGSTEELDKITFNFSLITPNS